MIRAGVGYSVIEDTGQAAVAATSDALRNAQLSRARAALCFATGAHAGAFPLLVRTVGERASTKNVVGCGAAGVIAHNHEFENVPAVAVAVFGGDGLRVQRAFVPGVRNREVEAARELVKILTPLADCRNLLLVFADSYNCDPELLVEELRWKLAGVDIIGAGATEDGSTGVTFQFCGNVVSNDSVCALLLSGNFELDIGICSAAQLLSGGHLVTAAQDNLLLELDGRPALEVFRQDVGALASDLRRALNVVSLCVNVRLGARRLERGAFVMRNILGLDPAKGFLWVGHELREGDLVGFALREPGYARADLQAMLNELSLRRTRSPTFGLYFDCVARGSAFYGIRDHDVSYIQAALGPLALAGFFTGFEVGPVAGATQALQYAGVLVLVSDCD